MGSVSAMKDSVERTAARKLVPMTAMHRVTVMRANVFVRKATPERTALSSHVQKTATKEDIVSMEDAFVRVDMREKAVQS